jgi:REP element-mobilizing transposase RayT
MKFGNIVGGKMKLNDMGSIVQDIWHQIPVHFLAVTTDEFVIMPNHIHGIVITGPYGNTPATGTKICSGAKTAHAVSLCPEILNSTNDGSYGNTLATGTNIFSGAKTVHAVSLCPESLNSCNDGQWDENRVPTVGQIVGYFKYQSTKKINENRNRGIQRIWQRNYYEHIVRDESDLNRICKYIQNNPLNWRTDKLHVI